MSLPIDLSIETLKKQEQDTVLPAFNAEVAWALGSLLREKSQSFDKAVVIDITLPSGQQLFRTVSRPGASLDNDGWIERKRRVVNRFNKASFHMGCEMRANGKTPDSFGLSESEYAFHGGAFPIRVKGVESPVAIVVVSGLRQDEDHKLAVEGLLEVTKLIKV